MMHAIKPPEPETPWLFTAALLVVLVAILPQDALPAEPEWAPALVIEETLFGHRARGMEVKALDGATPLFCLRSKQRDSTALCLYMAPGSDDVFVREVATRETKT